MFTFTPNKQFGQLINKSAHSLTMLNTTNTKFSSIEVWFTNQNSKPPEIEDSINMMLWLCSYYKNEISSEPKYRKYVKGYDFLSFVGKFGNK